MFSQRRASEKKEVTIVMIGDTGAGKSSFGNLYLKDRVFEESQSPMPVTLKAVAKSREINGLIRWVIDTEGLNDGNSINSIQIQNLAILLREYERGVNAIVIVINGRSHRFSQGVKDLIKFTYNSFGTKEVMNHICVVFTNCDNPRNPNRQLKKTEYREHVRNYLSEVSNEPIEKIPEVPIYFVDCCSEGENAETEENMTQFHGWACSKKALNTSGFVEAGLHEDHKIEKRNHFLVGTETRGDTTYEIYEDQERTKIIPNNRDPPRYTNWKCIKKYEEAVKKVITEKRNDVDCGYQYKDCPNGNIRYKVTVDQERKITKNLRNNQIIEETGWYNISDERLTEAGRYTEREETRNRKFERKEVEHHSGHGFFGGKDHTHVHLIHTVYTVKRTVKTNYDGSVQETEWLIVPGTQKSYNVGNWEEGGWTPGYPDREIAA